MSTTVANLMFNTAPLFGAGSAALVTAFSAAMKSYAVAAVGALVACRVAQVQAANRKPVEPEAYPSIGAEPWDFDGSPRGF